MDEADAPATPAKPARRPPAQKAAHEAGLAGDVFLHKDALGGFTESGRKPKRRKGADLSGPKRARRAKAGADTGAEAPGAAATTATPEQAQSPPRPARTPPGQRTLPSADTIGDDIVVIPSIGAAGRGGIVHLDEMDALPDVDEPVVPAASASLHDAARATLAEAVFHEVGRPGSLLRHPNGIAFQVRQTLGEGSGHTNHRVQVPLPGGRSTPHSADLAVELDNGALLVLDVLTSESSMVQVKAHAFDALQLRGISSCYAVLVFVQGRSGLERDHVETVCHGYDHFFGVAAEGARDPAKYTALRSRIASWIKAADRPA